MIPESIILKNLDRPERIEPEIGEDFHFKNNASKWAF